jgi:hypothetical protein
MATKTSTKKATGSKKKVAKKEVEATKATTKKKLVAKKDAPAKKASTRQKYDYPADITSSDDKKKFRAKMRTAAKKGDLPEKPVKKDAKVEATKTVTKKKKAPIKKKAASVD